MKKIGLALGILSCLLLPFGRHTLFGLHVGVYLTAFAVLGFYFAIDFKAKELSNKAKRLKIAAKIVCAVSAIANAAFLLQF